MWGMEIVVGFAGVVLGWLLAQVGELAASRRVARDAARVVLAELVDVTQQIEYPLAFREGWHHLRLMPIQCEAWATHRASLAQLIEVPTMMELASCYRPFAMLNAGVDQYRRALLAEAEVGG